MAEVSEVRDWQRPDMIELTKKDPNFGYRYFVKEHVDRRLKEGWEIVRKGTIKLANPESESMDGAIHYRGLILMRMPKRMVNQRNAFYIERHKRQLRAAGVAAKMSEAADKINEKAGTDDRGRGVAGTIGTVIIKTGVNMKDGSSRGTHTESFRAGEVDKQDLKDLAAAKTAQVEENNRMSEGEGDDPNPRRKSKKRR